jgi:RNA polymerase primary sigma factor
MDTPETGIRIYVREMGPIPCFSSQDEDELVERMGRGDREARSRMIRGGLRLVVDVAREYPVPEDRMLDVIAEGCRALTGAVDRFDAALGVCFSLFARPLIRQAVQKALVGTTPAVPLPRRSIAGLQAPRARMGADVPVAAGRGRHAWLMGREERR